MPTVLITGANRGLGLELARQYAADQWIVIACCRAPSTAEKLRALAATFPATRIETLDVADDQSIATLADRLKDTAIDLLINNAGIYSGGTEKSSAELMDKTQKFGQIDSAAWMKVLRVNTVAPIMIIQALISNLKKGTGKKIVNLSSRMGSLSEMGVDVIAYRSSKTALNGAMCVIAHDLRDLGLTIVNLYPGWVQTEMGGKSATSTPEQSVSNMRQVIAHLMPSNSGQFLNPYGQIIPW